MLKSDVAVQYSENISYDKNHVKKMIEEAFQLLNLDESGIGKPEWNPLGEYVHSGDSVLIKPNLVMHQNPAGEGEECLYTQAAVVGAIIDFVIIALKGTGKIIVGDAPMQGCHFEELIESSGYKNLILNYQKQGIDIRLCDFRNSVSEALNGVIVEKEIRNKDAITVNLVTQSVFFGLSEERIKNMRVTNYDPRVLQEHHSIDKHEYLVAREVLEADVVINVPKPKTHRKAGMTGALKNLVGINCSKEYLPHHTKQSKAEKGDAFLHEDIFLRLADNYSDKKCLAEAEHDYNKALLYRYVGGLFRHIGQRRVHERYSEGSWYGNDTIWRTLLDLNMILQYANKKGKIEKTRQRRILNIGDMIISGENDGPVRPSRKDVGIIIVSEDPCSFDEVVTALMGFDGEKIPTVKHMRDTNLPIFGEYQYCISSNNSNWNGIDVSTIYKKCNLNFVPNPGWKEVL